MMVRLEIVGASGAGKPYDTEPLSAIDAGHFGPSKASLWLTLLSAILLHVLPAAAGSARDDAIGASGALTQSETVVNGEYRLIYRLPLTNDVWLTPAPRNSIVVEPEKSEIVAGIAFPSGFFSRVDFSTLIGIHVNRWPSQVPDTISSAEFAKRLLDQTARQRRVAQAKGVTFLFNSEEPKEQVVGEKWWMCATASKAGEPDEVALLSCKRPLAEDLIVDVTATFGSPLKRNSRGLESERVRLISVLSSIVTSKKQ